MRSIKELIRTYGTDSKKIYTCFFHDSRTAEGLCERCGKDICPDCIVHEKGMTVCFECTRPFSRMLSSAFPWFTNHGLLLLALLLLTAGVYVLSGGKADNVTGSISSLQDPDTIILRNRLFMEKGVRLLRYADHLKHKHRIHRAERMFKRAGQSFEEVIKGLEIQHDIRLADIRSFKEDKIRNRFANVCILIARCCREGGDIPSARTWLRQASESKPFPETLANVYFRTAYLHEQHLNDPAGAVDLYAKARDTGTISIERFIDNAMDRSIEMLSQPHSETRTDSILAVLTGNADPAEAQYRIILCYDKLGMKEKVVSEYKIMKKEYPYSEWTREIARIGMIPEDESNNLQKTEISPSSEEKEEEEELTVTPLE